MAHRFRLNRLLLCSRTLLSASHERILEPGHSWNWRCVNVRHRSGSSRRGNGNGSGRGNGNGSGRGNGRGKKRLLVPQVIELQVEPDSDSGGQGLEYVSGSKRLEKLIHRNMAKMVAPAWLPFLPGMSYWVPPLPSIKFGEYVELEAAIGARNSMTEEEFLSFFATARRGWPCSSYFLQDESSHVVETTEEKNEKPEEES